MAFCLWKLGRFEESTDYYRDGTKVPKISLKKLNEYNDETVIENPIKKQTQSKIIAVSPRNEEPIN